MDSPPDTADDIACVLEYTSSSKEEFDAYILDTFQRMHMPLVKCSRKSRVQVVEGRVVKEICTLPMRSGRTTDAKKRWSQTKEVQEQTTRLSIHLQCDHAQIHSCVGHHGRFQGQDDEHLRERKLNPDSDYHKDESSLRYTRATTSTNMTTAITAPSSSSSPESLSNLMEQSSSIITALLKAEELESSAKDERIKQAVQEHATSLRLALEKLTAKIKSKYN
ncbi:hypothetical protein Ae201684P_020810 [Aphanomyces euteiches]|nr:hypothetical protein Ae201684P_020810 [Aphanomyces euteiches]